MPKRIEIPFYENVDEITEDEAKFTPYYIHKIGLNRFDEGNWTKGEKLFPNPSEVDPCKLTTDDIWIPGISALSHVFEGELKERDKKDGTKTLDLTGLHSNKYLEFYGAVCVPLVSGKNGVYTAKVTKNGIAKSAKLHTMYPDSWDWPEITEHFFKSLVNARYIGGRKFEGEYRMPKYEYLIKIHIVMNENFQVVTFWPIIEY
ncbi:EndoU domain-containing protein [Bacillus cereus]|uniref:EndoU domain-containing protein n=1 Tax=Bacillus cereus TaxID=1396 RepID=UPI00363C53DB